MAEQVDWSSLAVTGELDARVTRTFVVEMLRASAPTAERWRTGTSATTTLSVTVTPSATRFLCACLGERQRQDEKRFLRGGGEGLDSAGACQQQLGDFCGRHVSGAYPDHLRRRAVEERELAEVGVLGSTDVSVLLGVVPHISVRRGCEAALDDVSGAGEGARQRSDELSRQVLVEQELHVVPGLA